MVNSLTPHALAIIADRTSRLRVSRSDFIEARVRADGWAFTYEEVIRLIDSMGNGKPAK